MKNILQLLLIFLLSSSAFCQVSIIESFDAGSPAGWTDTYLSSSAQSCAVNSERDNLYSGSTSGNMTSPNQPGISNGTDVTYSIDYKIVDWSAATNATADGWGSAQLQFSTDDGVTWITVATLDDTNDSNSNICTTFGTIIPAESVPAGADLKFQVLNIWSGGDYYFYIDNFTATQVVNSEPNCDAVLTSDLSDFPTNGNLSWSKATGGATGYKVTIGSTMGGFDIANNVDVGTATTYTPVGLVHSTTYYTTITPYNSFGDATGCTEQSFTTNDPLPQGATCSDPIYVGALPFNATDQTTAGFGDDYDGSPGTSGCGSIFSYLSGDDIVYSYTSDEDGFININLSNISGAYTGVFVYGSCADIGSECIEGVVNGFVTTDINITSLPVVNGSTYYIVVSTWPNPQTTNFNLTISKNTCSTPTFSLAQGTNNCPADEFYINATVLNLGNVGSVDIRVGDVIIHSGVSVNTPYILGPYSANTAVTVVVGDANCNTTAVLTTPECPPANDLCINAIPITPDNNAVVSGSTSSATSNDAPAVGLCTATGDKGVWYSYTSSVPESVTIDFCANSTYDVDLIVMHGECGSMTCIEYQDAGLACGAPQYRPQYTFNTGDFGVTTGGQNEAVAPVTFYFYVHGYGGSSGEYGFVFPEAILPIDLISFDGKVMEEGNKLSWSTASEFNSEYHVVERSIDDARTWTEIGRVNAAGESMERTNYEFMDDNPVDKGLYRLVSIDYDRSQSISAIVSLERPGSGFGITTTFPNPAKDRVMVQYHSDANTAIQVEITNITGQVVQRIPTEGQDGMNNLDIDLTGLSAGTYFLKLSNDYEFVTERIIKQ